MFVTDGTWMHLHPRTLPEHSLSPEKNPVKLTREDSLGQTTNLVLVDVDVVVVSGLVPSDRSRSHCGKPSEATISRFGDAVMLGFQEVELLKSNGIRFQLCRKNAKSVTLNTLGNESVMLADGSGSDVVEATSLIDGLIAS